MKKTYWELLRNSKGNLIWYVPLNVACPCSLHTNRFIFRNKSNLGYWNLKAVRLQAWDIYSWLCDLRGHLHIFSTLKYKFFFAIFLWHILFNFAKHLCIHTHNCIKQRSVAYLLPFWAWDFSPLAKKHSFVTCLCNALQSYTL